MNTTTKQYTEHLDQIKSRMRSMITMCSRTYGKVIFGSNIRVYVNMCTGGMYYVADRMEDGVLRHAFFKNGVKEASVVTDLECSQSDWDEFLTEAHQLASELRVSIQVCEQP